MKVLEISNSALAFLLLVSFLHGCCISLLRNTFYILSNLLPVINAEICRYADMEIYRTPSVINDPKAPLFRKAAVNIFDMILCITAAFLLLLITFYYNDGNFRIITAAMSIGGFIFCERTLSAAYGYMLIRVIRLLSRILRTVFHPLVTVVSYLLGIFKILINNSIIRTENIIIRYYTKNAFCKLKKFNLKKYCFSDKK